MKRSNKKINWASAGLLMAGGAAVLAGCRTSEIQALAAGVGAASDTLITLDRNDNNSLRDLGDLGDLLINVFGD